MRMDVPTRGKAMYTYIMEEYGGFGVRSGENAHQDSSN